MKIGILGGTFNPIHNGHIEMANYAILNEQLSDVVILPSGSPPHKKENAVLSSYDRYEMCLLATMNNDRLVVDSLEIERKGKTFTVDTLKYYQQLYGHNNSIHYIIGGDTVLQLHKWRDFEKVFSLCQFSAFVRKGYDHTKIYEQAQYLRDNYGCVITFGKQEIVPISSTDIRKKISQNKSIQNLVPKTVESYINEHKLYR